MLSKNSSTTFENPLIGIELMDESPSEQGNLR